MEDSSRSSEVLGDLLRNRRRRRFQGRASEVELVCSTLTAAEPPFSVLFLHGPGGIGKTSLLDYLAESAADLEASVVRLDGRDIPPSVDAVLTALGDVVDVSSEGLAIRSPAGRLVLLVDTYERWHTLDDWFRSTLLPRLPASSLTVVAGRTSPSPWWRADPAWRELVRIVALRNLSPSDSRDYLRANGVEPRLHDRIVNLSHGHPLALSLLTDIAVRGDDVTGAPLTPDLVATLLHRFVEIVPSDLHRRALAVCSLARVTTEPLLRAALEVDDAGEIFDWLRGLSFIEVRPDGILPHDLARDLLDADLRWRDPDGYQRVFRRVRTHIHRRLESTRGRDQQRAVYDEKFVFRQLPGIMSPVAWDVWGDYFPEPATKDDRASILDLTGNADGPESAAIAGHWLDRQPESFQVVREHDGRFRGFVTLLNLTRASPVDVAADPGTAAAWAFAHGRSPPRPGEVVGQTRFIIDTEFGHAPSPTQNTAPVLTMQLYVSTPQLSWDFLTLADPDPWNAYFAVADLPRAIGADFIVDGRPHGLFAHDFRAVPVDAWLELVTDRALSQDLSLQAKDTESMLLVLSQAEFEQAVRRALRDLHRVDLLANSPLLATRLLHDRVPGQVPDPSALADLLREAAQTLADHPRDQKLLRVIDRTYLRPSTTQEGAAAVLGLPFSTYRRHLTQGVARMLSWLWDREVYGLGGPIGPQPR